MGDWVNKLVLEARRGVYENFPGRGMDSCLVSVLVNVYCELVASKLVSGYCIMYLACDLYVFSTL